MNPLFSIIIPTHNRLPILKRTLELYESQKGIDFPFEIIVVDDGSTDATWDFLSSYAATKFSLACHRQENKGPAQARNLGIRQSRGQLLLITGDDILPDENFLAGHRAAHHSQREMLAVLGQTLWHPELHLNSVMKHIDGAGGEQFSYQHFKNRQRMRFWYFYTSNISFPRAALNKLDKLFDTDFRNAAYEDVEFAYRLMGNSKKILYCEELRGYHHHIHTLESFARRQYLAGCMASVLANKHPELKSIIGFETIDEAFAAARELQTSLSPKQIHEDEQLLIEMLKPHEDSSGVWLDNLYSAIFLYFHHKGFAEEHFNQKESAPLALCLLASCLKEPLLKSIERQDCPFNENQKADLKKMLEAWPTLPKKKPSFNKKLIDKLNITLKKASPFHANG